LKLKLTIALKIKRFHGKTKKEDCEGFKPFVIKLAQLVIEDSIETKFDQMFCKFISTPFQRFKF
jgi:hypothetical protein